MIQRSRPIETKGGGQRTKVNEHNSDGCAEDDESSNAS
jgi:hypothetical protein